ARREHEHRRAAVEDVSGSDLRRAFLQARVLHLRGAPIVAQDAEDRADAAAHIEIRRAVERIEEHDVRALALRLTLDDDRLLVLLRRDDGDAGARTET